MSKPYRISKSRYMSGKRCLLTMWHEVHKPDLVPEPDDAALAIMEAGHDVGAVAHQAYPGGVLIESDRSEPDMEFLRTEEAMADPNVPAIFEASIRHGNEMARIDVLKRVEGEDAWDLIEVKSSSHVKDEHILDTAFQLRLLRKNGVKVRRVEVHHPNKAYVLRGELDPKKFLTGEDVTPGAKSLMPEVEADLIEFHKILTSTTPPTGPHVDFCSDPKGCPFHSRQVNTEHPIDHLPFLSKKARGILGDEGITDIRDIPEDFGDISERQMRVRDVVVNGEPYFDVDEIEKAFRNLQGPIHFIDFETFQPAIPLYQGTKPFQTIPFQWSLHTLLPSGRLYHKEYLHADESDPRRRFAERLIKGLEDGGSIMVYSSHERKTLEGVAKSFPDLKPELDALIDRFEDLLKILRANVYFQEFQGSHSLKKVLPALVPGLSYDDLSLQNGALAAGAFAEIIREDTPMERRAELSTDLLKYCERDTEALARIYLAILAELRRRREPETKQPRKRRGRGRS